MSKRLNWLTKSFFGVVGAAGLSTLGLAALLGSQSEVKFESLESVTETGAPVFNQIRYLRGDKIDIWLMRQSHEGIHKEVAKWDRLAIVVDKTRNPKEAKFFQFAPGPLEMAALTQAVPYKARCFACHPNGPRAIRPRFNSESISVGIMGRIRVFAWNLRVKTYGKVESQAGQSIEGGAPFKSKYPILSRALGLASCKVCHSSAGIRNELKWEQAGTAKFLVNHGIMPPFPFRVTQAEKEELGRLAN